MKTTYINKIDTTTDWFSSTVEHIESLTGAEADWGAIDSDPNALGNLMGYYRKDGKLYRAEHDPSRSDSETDCIVFEEQEESAYSLQHAIDSTECSIGYWTIDKDEDRTMLVWRGDIEDLPEDMEGDEPWKKWGGDEILDKAGIDILSHATGIDSYTDQYGDEVQEQWVIIEGE